MAEKYPHLHIILLANDYGEKLWPIARRQSPACLAPIAPGAKDSLLTATVARVQPYTEHPLHIITNEDMGELIYGELRARAGLSPEDFEFVYPPADRGTAFSIALVCACIRRDDPEAVVVVMNVDQNMEEDERWPHLLYAAYQVALQDNIALIGSRQREKCRDVSYIRAGSSVEGIDGAYEVRVFAPDTRLAPAKRALHEGAYWYTGIFAGRAATILGTLANPVDRRRRLTSEIEASRRIAETASLFAMLGRDLWNTPDAEKIASTLTSANIEKAALEYAENLVLMATTIEFTTSSTFVDVDANTPADRFGNRLLGNALAIDGRNTTILAHTPQRFIATYGLDDITIVDTPDALLVAKKDMLRDTEVLLGKLQEANVAQVTSSAHRSFAWGSATLISQSEKSATWRIELPAGSTLDTLTVPLEYDAFEGASARGMREQYVVAEGDVLIQGRNEDDAAQLIATGSSFESNSGEPLLIMCVEENPATLILTAVL